MYNDDIIRNTCLIRLEGKKADRINLYWEDLFYLSGGESAIIKNGWPELNAFAGKLDEFKGQACPNDESRELFDFIVNTARKNLKTTGGCPRPSVRWLKPDTEQGMEYLCRGLAPFLETGFEIAYDNGGRVEQFVIEYDFIRKDGYAAACFRIPLVFLEFVFACICADILSGMKRDPQMPPRRNIAKFRESLDEFGVPSIPAEKEVPPDDGKGEWGTLQVVDGSACLVTGDKVTPLSPHVYLEVYAGGTYWPVRVTDVSIKNHMEIDLRGADPVYRDYRFIYYPKRYDVSYYHYDFDPGMIRYIAYFFCNEYTPVGGWIATLNPWLMSHMVCRPLVTSPDDDDEEDDGGGEPYKKPSCVLIGGTGGSEATRARKMSADEKARCRFTVIKGGLAAGKLVCC